VPALRVKQEIETFFPMNTAAGHNLCQTRTTKPSCRKKAEQDPLSWSYGAVKAFELLRDRLALKIAKEGSHGRAMIDLALSRGGFLTLYKKEI
jgi:hypothetical protein